MFLVCGTYMARAHTGALRSWEHPAAATMMVVSYSSVAVPWPMSLSTTRLVLRPVEVADIPAISRLWTDPQVRQYLGGPVGADEVARRERGYAGSPGTFGVISRTDETVLGLVTMTPDSARDGQAEVSYLFLPEHWGHGYAREAVSAVVTWALQTISPPPVVVAVTQEANERSRHLLESVGMTLIDNFIEFDAPQVMYSIARAALRA
jgi:RimJ/RimL family protein N-acetyltransferase